MKCIFKDFVFYCYIGVWLINNVVILSGVQQSDSVIHIQVSSLGVSAFKFYTLRRFNYPTLLPTAVTTSHITPSGRIHLTVNVCTLLPYFPHLPAPGNHVLLLFLGG